MANKISIRLASFLTLFSASLVPLVVLLFYITSLLYEVFPWSSDGTPPRDRSERHLPQYHLEGLSYVLHAATKLDDVELPKLTIRLDNFRPETQSARLTFTLNFPDITKPYLKDGYTPTLLPPTGEKKQWLLDEKYQNLFAQLVVAEEPFSFGSSQSVIAVPLQTIVEAEGKADTVIATREFSMKGSLTNYPSDRYSGGMRAHINLPGNINLQTGNSAHYYLPFATTLLLSQEFLSYDVIVSGKTDDPQETSFRITLERKPLLMWHTYIAACIPILLALVFAHAMFWSRRKTTNSHAETLLDMAALLLAVLPVRSVLIQAPPLEVTRVDLILGVGVAGILLVALWKYCLDEWRA